MIIEPGIFLAAEPTKLETEILSIHGNNILVDASVYNSYMDTIIIPIKPIIKKEPNLVKPIPVPK